MSEIYPLPIPYQQACPTTSVTACIVCLQRRQITVQPLNFQHPTSDGLAAPILDVDWRNNNMFATSSSDKTIYVAKVGEGSPVKAFVGHTDEVNCINWDGEGGWKLPSVSSDQRVGTGY